LILVSDNLKKNISNTFFLDFCVLLPHAGVGYSELIRYFYDYNQNECRQFSYKGYAGNRNNFKTKKNCELVCNPRHKNSFAEPDNEIIGLVYTCTNNSVNGIHVTFDDGPFLNYTPQLLDTLKKYNVKATFFLVAKQVLLYPDIVQRMLAEGHNIGSHTYSHINIVKLEGENKTNLIEQEIIESEKIFQKTVGFKPWLFRAPYIYKQFL
jgi:hypothetical protein